jgi:hypothetical protein
MAEQVLQDQSNKTDFDNHFTAKTSRWSALKDWDILRSQVEIRKILDSESSNDGSGDHGRQRMFVGSHFQRFVRRMESAGPRIILERLKEKWALPGDRAMSDELQLEQHLWALTALQLPSMDRFVRAEQHNLPYHPLPPTVSRRQRKILELDGSIGEHSKSFTGCNANTACRGSVSTVCHLSELANLPSDHIATEQQYSTTKPSSTARDPY